MNEQTFPVAARPGARMSPRNMVLTLMADRLIRTEQGERPAAQLRPGDRMLSGHDAGMSVLSVAFADAENRRGRACVVKVVVGRDSDAPIAATPPIAGHVSRQDGQLHMNSRLPLSGRGAGPLTC